MTKDDLTIWREEIEELLPERIIDFHCHIWLRSHLPRGWSIESSEIPLPCDEFPLDDLIRIEHELFPGREVKSVCFGLPVGEIDMAENNAYVSRSSRRIGGHPLMMPPLDASVEELDEMVEEGGFIGFKPYWTFVRWKEREEVRIEDMVTEAQLEVANSRGLIILLHIPRRLRLADPDNLLSIEMIARRYPNLRLVIAHVGRSYCSWPAREGLDRLKDLENVYFDTAMVQNAVVYQLLFRKIGLSRILFGTDLPIAREKGRVVCVNGVNLFVTERRFPWSLSLIHI